MDVVLAVGHAAMLVSMAAQMTEPNEIPVAMASGAMVEPFSDSVASVTEPATTFTKKRKNQEVPFSGYTTARKTAVNMVYAWWLITAIQNSPPGHRTVHITGGHGIFALLRDTLASSLLCRRGNLLPTLV